MEGAIKLLQRKVAGVSYYGLTGKNSQVGFTNSTYQITETLSEDSTLFSWSAIGGNIPVSVKTTSSGDAGKVARVEYVDVNFIKKYTTVTLPSPGTSVSVASDVYRINKVTLNSFASGTIQFWTPYMYGSELDIYVIVARNKSGNHGIFTVPKGETYALMGVDMINSAEDHSVLKIRARTHSTEVGGTRLTSTIGFDDVLTASCPVNTVFDSSILAVPYLLPEGTDIELLGVKMGGADNGYANITATAHLVRFE